VVDAGEVEEELEVVEVQDVEDGWGGGGGEGVPVGGAWAVGDKALGGVVKAKVKDARVVSSGRLTRIRRRS